ncbi:MAG: glycosyltransferase family 2 protein [bacterium]
MKRKKLVDDAYFPSVSMLISVYNEEKIIEEKIKNFLEIDYPEDKLQLFIGSDGSDDKTEELIKKYENLRIKLLPFTERKGKSAVLNRLAASALGDILIFSDANTFYHKDTIKKIVGHFAEKNVGGVCGKLLLINSDEKNVGGWGEKIYWTYENKIKEMEGKIRTTIGATGGIYAIKKELFQPVPEDKSIACDFLIPLLIAGRGFDIVYDKYAVAEENTSANVKKEFIRKIRIGAQCFQMLPFIAYLLNPLKGFVSFGLWSHKIIRWFTPFLIIAIFILNIFILNHTLYLFFFILQVLFYLFAFFGFLLNLAGKKFFLFSAPFYYVMVNLALLFGFFKFLFTLPKPIWETADR